MLDDKSGRRAAGLAISLAAFIAIAAAWPRAALADGAFPDSDQLVLPLNTPHRVMLGTNFGLLISENDGASWTWVCEQAVANCTTLYQLNANEDRIFVVSQNGLAVLPQDGCGVSFSTGPFLAGGVSDVFPDPSNSSHLLLISVAQSDAASPPSGIYASNDAGLTFGEPLIQAPTDSFFGGVEIAHSDPKTVYATQCVFNAASAPSILRSSDGGASFTTVAQPALGNQCLHIAAVDPNNPMRVFFRGTDGPVDSLIVTEDGGATTRVALSFPSSYLMTAFLLRADGTILVSGMQENTQGSTGTCGSLNFTGVVSALNFISTDGGQTFSPWANAPHVRALAERNGVLYVAANNFADGFAVATSTDQGAHYTPILLFNQILGPLPSCPSVDGACAQPWALLETTFGIGTDMATATPKRSGGSCSCSLGRSTSDSFGAIAALCVALLAFARQRVARRR